MQLLYIFSLYNCITFFIANTNQFIVYTDFNYYITFFIYDFIYMIKINPYNIYIYTFITNIFTIQQPILDYFIRLITRLV